MPRPLLLKDQSYEVYGLAYRDSTIFLILYTKENDSFILHCYLNYFANIHILKGNNISQFDP